MSHQCQALVVVCMDFRFQTSIFEFLREQGLAGQYDLFSAAGTQKTFIDPQTQALALKQVELSIKLHGSSAVYLIAHRDCGAYGGSPAFESPEQEKQTYINDLQQAEQIILEKFPQLQIKKYLANLNQEQQIAFEKI